jgi:SDR family mycofactocin-dependent oxidoreductase
VSRSLEGKVAFITGAARGQGRAHAVKLATLGADIIGVDICADIPSMDYPNGSLDDLGETERLVKEAGRTMLARPVDVRDHEALQTALDEGIRQLGRLDIVIANAGIARLGAEADPWTEWKDIVDTNLTGVWNTARVAIPELVNGGRGGSIVFTSSSAGLKGTGTDRAGGQAYTASKRGLVGLMEVFANDLAKHSIRVNTIHPTGVATGMVMNPAMQAMFEANDPVLSSMQNALPIEILQPEDIANAVAWLVSDEAFYITGVAFPLDAGFSIR